MAISSATGMALKRWGFENAIALVPMIVHYSPATQAQTFPVSELPPQTSVWWIRRWWTVVAQNPDEGLTILSEQNRFSPTGYNNQLPCEQINDRLSITFR